MHTLPGERIDEVERAQNDWRLRRMLNTAAYVLQQVQPLSEGTWWKHAALFMTPCLMQIYVAITVKARYKDGDDD